MRHFALATFPWALLLCTAAAALAGCTATTTTVVPAAPAAPPTPQAVATASAPALERPSPPWTVLFERACKGSVTDAVVSRAEELLAYCSGLFSLPRGEFRSTLPIGALAFVDDGRLLTQSYEGTGLELVSLPGAPETPLVTTGEGSVEAAALAPNRKRVAAVIALDDVVSARIYALPTLEEVLRAPVTGAAHRTELGWLADGTPLVLADPACALSDVPCTDAKRAVYRVAAGKVEPLGPSFTGVEHMAVADNGSRALVLFDDGRRAVLGLPAGETLATLPSLPADEEWLDMSALGLDAKGERLAFFEGRDLIIAELRPSGLRELARAPELAAEVLAFSADGRTLYAADSYRVAVVREGAPETPLRLAGYRPRLPEGFVMTYERGAPPPPDADAPMGVAIERVESEGEIVGESVLPFGTLVRYRDEETTVTVVTGDLDELPPRETPLSEWADAVLARDLGDSDEPAQAQRSWQRGAERSLEYAVFVRDGCDPVDVYARVTEHDGVLYRIEIVVAPGSPRSVVEPLLRVFLDAPLGPPDDARAFTTPTRVHPGPC